MRRRGQVGRIVAAHHGQGVLAQLRAPGAVGTTASRYTVTSSSMSPAAGSQVTITAQLVDATGANVASAGHVVTWTRTGGGTFSSPTSTTDASGAATVTLTCPTTVGSVQVTGTDAGNLSGVSGAIAVVPGPLSVSNSTVTAVPATLPADGVSTATITLQARDQYGNHLTASAGTWVPAASAGSIGPVTDWGDGHYTATYTAGSVAATASITGTLAGGTLPTCSVSLTGSGSVTITATPSANATQGAVTLQYTVAPGAGITIANVRVDLFDANGRKAIPGASSLPTSGTVGLGWRLAGGSYTPQVTATDTTGATYTRSFAAVTIASRPSTAITAATGTPDVTVDVTTKFQTWRGFEAVVQIGFDMTPAYSTWSPLVKDQEWQAYLDAGVTRLRVEFSHNAVIAGTPNTYDFTDLDQKMNEVVLPMRAAYLAAGRALPYVINYVDYSNPSPIGTDTTKYSNMVLAVYQHIAANGWPTPAGWQVWNEPDNNTAISRAGSSTPGAILGGMMAATASLFQAQTPALTPPNFIFSGFFNASLLPTWWGHMTAAQQALAKELSFHRYQPIDTDKTNQPNMVAALTSIASLSASTGLPVSQNEANEPSGGDAIPTPDSVWLDLTRGNVSAWNNYTLAYGTGDAGGGSVLWYNLADTTAPVVNMSARTHLLRQMFKYLRPGAVRVSATASASGVRPLAFLNPDGTLVVAIDHATNGQLAVQVPPGDYSGEYGIFVNAGTVAPAPDGLLATATIGSGQLAAVSVPAGAGFDNNFAIVQKLVRPNNEPGGMTPLFHQMGNKQTVDLFGQTAQLIDSNFNGSSPLNGMPYVEVVPDPAAPFGQATEHRWIYDNNSGDREGTHLTAVTWTAFGGAFAAGMSKQYLRFVVMHSPNWVGHSGGDKLGYLLHGNPTGTNQHWMVFRGTRNDGSTLPYYRDVNPPQQLFLQTQTGAAYFPTAKVMNVGLYHTIEVFVQAESVIGAGDGVFQQWVDGVQVANVSTVAWGGTNRLFSGYKWEPFWGGNTTPTSYKHMVDTAPTWQLGTYDYIRFGELYISGAL